MTTESTNSRKLVDWYRVDPTPRVAHVLAIAVPMIFIGCVCLALAWIGRQETAGLRWVFACVGALSNVGGPVYAIVGLRRVLTYDEYVAMRSDGLEVRLEAHSAFYDWESLDELVLDERGGIALPDAYVVLPARFSGIDARELVRRIEQQRKRALLGLHAPK